MSARRAAVRVSNCPALPPLTTVPGSNRSGRAVEMFSGFLSSARVNNVRYSRPHSPRGLDSWALFIVIPQKSHVSVMGFPAPYRDTTYIYVSSKISLSADSRIWARCENRPSLSDHSVNRFKSDRRRLEPSQIISHIDSGVLQLAISVHF